MAIPRLLGWPLESWQVYLYFFAFALGFEVAFGFALLKHTL